jgi:hypothetical protein
MDVYFISGLGADKRAFKYLQLDSRLSVYYIDWLANKPKESLVEYSIRMAQSIDVSRPFCLVGLSFGGIIVNEISKVLSPEKIVFVSTAKTKWEIPWYFRLAGVFNLHHLMPTNFSLSNRKLIHSFFGTKSEKEKEILNEILNDTDPVLLKWSIDKIVKWENTDVPIEYLHLHGENDVVFPIKNIKNGQTILDGTHLAVVKKYRSISDAINQYLLDN